MAQGKGLKDLEIENTQENSFAPYELQFSIQERKELVAEMLRELRKAKSYQQKDIAAKLGISPQTYNGYEKGRNEPPIEILVRLSFLYQLPIDILVQRDRFNKMNESAMVTVAKMENELLKVKEEFHASELAENPQLNDLMGMMEKLTDAMKTVVSSADSKPKYRK